MSDEQDLAGQPPEHEAKPKREDVGYKRPPKEHRFKKGNKPKPRKPKFEPEDLSIPRILWAVLNEDVRIGQGRNVKYMRTSDLLVRKVLELAEKGDTSMGKLAFELLMLGQTPGQDEPETYLTMDRLDGSPPVTHRMETGYGR